MPNEQCPDSFFDNCGNDKKHWTWEQSWRKLFAKITGSDCPALRVTGEVTAIVAGGPVANTIESVSVKAAGSLALDAVMNAKLATMTNKVFLIVESIDSVTLENVARIYYIL